MKKTDVIKKLENGEIKMYQLDKMFSSSDATNIRREYVEKIKNVNLKNISKYTLDMDKASQKNIENSIGSIQIPIGIAGPLKVNGKHAQGKFHIPIATSEGALVASINRGCSVITMAGGVNTLIVDDKMTRSPAIRTKSIQESCEIKLWIENNFLRLKKMAETTTKHGKLVKIDPILIAGNYLYPRFSYSTVDSMGMNMVTIATEKALELLEDETSGEVVSLSGNACVDKKPSNINLIEGRGKSLIADIIVPEEIVASKLKTTAKSVEEVNTIKNLIGSAVSGSMGFNAHYANIVAGLFLATGQDIAHVVEGSLGITTAEDRNGDLYFSVTMPDLPIATVGGGTSLETATESLKILDCYGSGKVKKLAEIIIGTVLGGELSLIAALSAGHLSKAHKTHGRAK
jgi:hydroxymethylglutaryl-CoA reductase (NADPH)